MGGEKAAGGRCGCPPLLELWELTGFPMHAHLGVPCLVSNPPNAAALLSDWLVSP